MFDPDDGYATRLRERLARSREDGLPFEVAWDKAIAQEPPPSDWGADSPPRGDLDASVTWFTRIHMHHAYTRVRLPEDWALGDWAMAA